MPMRNDAIMWVRAPTLFDRDGNPLPFSPIVWGKVVDRDQRGNVLIMSHTGGSWVPESAITLRRDVYEDIACMKMLGVLPLDFVFVDVAYTPTK